MIISHEHNFIYIANPRTATVSMNIRLSKFDSFNNQMAKHITPKDAKTYLEENNLPVVDYTNFYEFVFVRHPYTRLLSIFYQAKFIHPASGNKPTFKQDVAKSSVISIDTFLDKYEDVINGVRIEDLTPFSQLKYTTNTFTNNLRIYKFENLLAEYDKIKSDLGLDLMFLLHINRSPIPVTADTLLPHQKARIYSLFRDEFDAYGYLP